MRQLGLWLSRVALHLLFIGATVSLLLGLLTAAGDALVWRGLDFPVGLRQAVRFAGAAIVGYGLGGLLYAGLRGLFPAAGDATGT